MLNTYTNANVNSSDDDTSFAVLIDAGSSGSRVHVFELRQDNSQGDIPNIRLPPHKLKIEPGLSSYEDRPEDAGHSLQPLIDFAASKVPSDQWAETPIILAATAGVRMLSNEAADRVMRACMAFLRESPFKV